MRGSNAEVGSTRVSANGYHYTKLESGWELTQRILAEKKLGRPLKSDEYVKNNGDKANPQIEDIEVCKRGKASLRRRKAVLEARMQDIQDELSWINSQLTPELAKS